MNAVTDPIEKFIALVATARSAGKHELATWLEDGLNAYVFDGQDLEKSLGLNGDTGKPKAKNTWAMQLRNDALATAFHHIEGNNTAQRIEALRTQLRSFEAIVWPRYMDRQDPPADWSLLRKSIFKALKSGCSLPTSTRQLYKVIFNW